MRVRKKLPDNYTPSDILIFVLYNRYVLQSDTTFKCFYIASNKMSIFNKHPFLYDLIFFSFANYILKSKLL